MEVSNLHDSPRWAPLKQDKDCHFESGAWLRPEYSIIQYRNSSRSLVNWSLFFDKM